MIILNYIILVLGILCLVYYGIIIGYSGTSTSFAWFWLLAGIFCISLFVIIRYIALRKIIIPWPVRYFFTFIVVCGLFIFFLIEGMIIYHANRKADPGMDYLIVLGAQIRGTQITNSLYKRLKVSEMYLKENPETKVIVSGGKGPGEDIAEAEAMKKFLIENGIEEKRILVEDKSTSTVENIRFSRRLITKENAKVAIVTNGFHVFRSVGIAKKQGLADAQGLAAPSDKVLLISYYVREVLGVIKDFALGNM